VVLLHFLAIQSSSNGMLHRSDTEVHCGLIYRQNHITAIGTVRN